MIRVELPHHLKILARVDGDVSLEVSPPVTMNAILDALEARYPMLRGTIREHETRRRRPRVRFYADLADISHAPLTTPLPESIASGREPLRIVGAISGG